LDKVRQPAPSGLKQGAARLRALTETRKAKCQNTGKSAAPDEPKLQIAGMIAFG